MMHRHQYNRPRVTQVYRRTFFGDRVSYSNFTWICSVLGCAKVKTEKQKGIYELPIVDREIEQLESMYANSPRSEA